MRKYELMIIYDPSLEEDDVAKELSKITSFIEKKGGEIVDKENWGVKKLAYPIKHQEDGYYCLIHFNSGNRVITEINRMNKINDKVLRHLIVKRKA